jgi:hypothetical protein
MIVYLAQKYLINSTVFFVALVIFPLGFFDNTEYVIARGFIFGGLFGGVYTVYDFKKRKIWPLYDNLRLPKILLMVFFYIVFQTLYFILKPFL